MKILRFLFLFVLCVCALPTPAQMPQPAPSFKRIGEPVYATVPMPLPSGPGKVIYGQVGVSEDANSPVDPDFGFRTGAAADVGVRPKSRFLLNTDRFSNFVDQQQNSMNAPLLSVSDPARILSRYDVELIVDASMSMRRPDCPGFLSRWQWCGSQSVDLAQKLAPFASQGITLTSFNRNFYVYEHQSPQQITTLFGRTPLALNTRLAEPLADRLNDYLIHSHRPGARPRLIAVITDGVPHPPEQVQMVKDVLVHASNMIQDPRELTVVFFQIGSRDFRGQQFLADIDNNLVAGGAHFDIVQTVSFQHLQRVGLAQGLADAIKRFDNKTRD